jgi:hypothetical protein
MSNIFKQFSRPGLYLTLAAMLGVLAWRGGVVLHRGWQLQKMADELGSIGRLESAYYDWDANRRFIPNHSNTGVVYAQYTPTGLGIYLRNFASGQAKLVCEQSEKGWSAQLFGMFGWSPDDQMFACAVPIHGSKQTREEIVVGDGTSGEVVAHLAASAYLKRLTWLSNNSFIYSYPEGKSYDLNVIQQAPDKTWTEAHKFQHLDKGVIGLVATSANTVVWQNGKDLMMLDFDAGTPKKIWESTTNRLQSFTYQESTGDFTLNCVNKTGPVEIGFRPPSKGHPAGTLLNHPVAAAEKPGTADLHIEGGQNIFYLQARGHASPTQLAWPGHIMSYEVNGDSLYIAGDLAAEMPGIWKYDFNSGEYNRVVSAWDHPLKYARLVGAQSGALTNADGKASQYLMWQPAHFEAGKKYPLIIGQTCYFQWQPYPQVAANAGSYFMLVTRPTWFDGLENWRDDVMRAYALAVKNPNVDTNRIYLYGVSGENFYLSQLLAENTNLWRGAILFVPEAVSMSPNVGISRLLIVDGAVDGKAATILTQNGDRLAEAGISVNLSLVKGAAHVFKSTTVERESDRQLARFISGD